jgi:hypothetical protein
MKDRDALVCERESTVETIVQIRIYSYYIQELILLYWYIDIFVNCSWVDTRWQYTFTHKQYIEYRN